MKIIASYNQKIVFITDLSTQEESENTDEMILVNITPYAVLTFLDLLKSKNFMQLPSTLSIAMTEPITLWIDHRSCDLAFHKLWDQVELEDALHWLSTLGGAYSNLGDHSIDFVSKKMFLCGFL